MQESDAANIIRRLEDCIRDCRHGGPGQSDQKSFWFQLCCNYVSLCSPMDVLISQSQSSVMMGDQIRMALIMTINSLVDSSSGIQLALSEVGSKKFFASLAVDAWMNEDYENVRKFIIKSIIFEHLQHDGAQKVLADINQPPQHQDRYSMWGRVEGALQCHNAGLKDILEYCTDGTCSCIRLSQTLNEEKELLLNPNADRKAIEARRKEREVERLPPVLKPSSEYWRIKEKASAHLRKGNLGESSSLYLAAKTMLEKERDLQPPIHQKEWMEKVGGEIGRIASNLSMICIQKNTKHNFSSANRRALKYADEAVCHCPGWPKAYCRRALALKSLGRFDEAQLAIYNAIKKTSPSDATTERELREYQKIQNDIEKEQANQKLSHPVENPLYWPWKSELVKKEVGTIGCFSGNDDIMEIIYSYLTPLDVANLERVCKRFATNVEIGRRIAIGSKLLAGIHLSADLTSAVTVKNSLVKYTNAVDSSPTIALQKFVAEVHPMIDDCLWEDFSHVKVDPLSFETILASAFSTSSAVSMHRLYEMLDLEFVSANHFQMAKLLLQGKANACRSIQFTLVSHMGNLLDDDGGFDEDEVKQNFSRRFFQNSLDLEIMRLAMSIEDDYDELKQMAYVTLNNAILVKGGRRKQHIKPNDPLYVINMSFHSFYNEFLPDDYPYPGLIEDRSFSWKNGTIDKATIKECWNDATFYRMWKMAILKSLEWVHQVEKEDLISDFLLVSRVMQGDINLDALRSPINCFSLGPFLVMKSVEFGGAVSMSVRLRSKEDLTDFFYDYFSFLKLYGAGFRALAEFNERTLAAHYS